MVDTVALSSLATGASFEALYVMDTVSPRPVAPNLTNTCEGIGGTAITTTNTSGPNQFDHVVTTGTGVTVNFDSTYAHAGTTSAKLHMPAGAVSAYTDWIPSIVPTPVNSAYVRVYCYLTAYPTVNTRVISLRHLSTLAGAVQITTTGTLQTLDANGTAIAATTATAPLNAWFRVEFEITNINGNLGDFGARLFSGVNLETETVNTGGSLFNTSQSCLGSVSIVRFGVSASTTLTADWDLWLDDPAWSDKATPGWSIIAVGPSTFHQVQPDGTRGANFSFDASTNVISGTRLLALDVIKVTPTTGPLSLGMILQNATTGERVIVRWVGTDGTWSNAVSGFPRYDPEGWLVIA